MKSAVLFVLFAFCLCLAKAGAEEALVVMVRHGEKSNSSGTGLTPDGERRAHYLSRCMAHRSMALRLGTPTVIVTASATKSSDRPAQTAAPLAKALSLPLQRVPVDDVEQFGAIVSRLEAGSTLVVFWKHHELPSLARSLHLSSGPWPERCNAPEWPEPAYLDGSSCYDLMWVASLQRSAQSKPWNATGILDLMEGFGGAAESPCAEALAPLHRPPEQSSQRV